ncbi:MAG: aldo/keto reductase [Clostridia bacterium]
MTPSKMTLGTVQLGLDYGITNREGKPSREKSFAILSAAWENGIRSLDTAFLYGDSETIIGEYFSAFPHARNHFSVTTKFKLGQVETNKVQDTVRRSLETSLERLGLDRLDTLLMHDAREYMVHGTTLDRVFEDLLREKTIARAGASAYRYEEIEPMLANPLYGDFQLPMSVMDQRIFGNASRIRALSGKRIHVRSIYLQGLFFMDPGRLEGNLRQAAPYLEIIRETARGLGMPVSEFAIRYMSHKPFIHSLVIGCDNPDQVRENAAFMSGLPLEGEGVRHMERKLKDVPEWLFYPMLWDPQQKNVR